MTDARHRLSRRARLARRSAARGSRAGRRAVRAVLRHVPRAKRRRHPQHGTRERAGARPGGAGGRSGPRSAASAHSPPISTSDRLHAAAAARRSSRAARASSSPTADPGAHRLRRLARQGPPIPEPHPERGNVAEGQHLFTVHCAGCHQVVGAGRIRHGGGRRRRSAMRRRSQVAEAVRIGPYVMPRFSRSAISDRELDSLIAYVDTRSTRTTAAAGASATSARCPRGS